MVTKALRDLQQFNRLTPAQHERLAFLGEELNEAGVAIGKILRHGFESQNPCAPVEPGKSAETNRSALEREIGDVSAAIDLLTTAGDLSDYRIGAAGRQKLRTVKRWMHHQD